MLAAEKRERKYFDTKRCGKSEKDNAIPFFCFLLPASARDVPLKVIFSLSTSLIVRLLSSNLYFFLFSLFKVIIQLKTSLIRNIIHNDGAVINKIHRAV
jgi:hypothetical protein